MAAPRKTKFTNVPNLYVKRDVRTGKLSCQYRDIRPNAIKEWWGLGNDLQLAEHRARQLNAVIAQQIIDQETQAILQLDRSHSITVIQWHAEYIEILRDRVAHKEIKQSTFDQKRWAFKSVLEVHGKQKLSQLTTVAISKLIANFSKAGKQTMAQRVRTVLIEFFDEAIAAGHFPADKPNPAKVTRMPRIKVKRARLTTEMFLSALDWARANQRAYLWHSYLLAATTAQRLDDIGNASFKDVVATESGKCLTFIQSKTGTKIMIPLALRLDILDISVGDVVRMCRDNVASPWLFHHSKPVGKAKKGDQIRIKSLSNGFAQAIRAVQPNWGDNLPPSFHEIRSWSEREYRKQGINTQKLLGHKHQSTTDIYADTRGHDWILVDIGNP